MTAAHCVDEVDWGLSVLVYADNLCRGDQIRGFRVPVIDIAVHPRFDATTGRNDIALLTLASPVSTDHVRRIANQQPDSDAAVALGWGHASGTGPRSCRLVRTHLSIVPLDDCASRVGTGLRKFEPVSMVCAIPEGGTADTCVGDSGGPLLSDDSISGEVIGIVSWGYGCAGGAGVYARPDVLWSTDNAGPASSDY